MHMMAISRLDGHRKAQQAVNCVHLASESRCRRPRGGGRGGRFGPMETKPDKERGETILADILRTSFMDVS